MRRGYLCLFLVFVFVKIARGDELADLLKTFRARVSAELNSIQVTQPVTEREQREKQQKEHRLMQAVSGLEAAIAAGRTEEVIMLTGQLRQEGQLTPETIKFLDDLKARLPALIAQRDANYLKSLDQLEETTRNALLKAKTADELNHLSGDIAALTQGQRDTPGLAGRQSSERINSMESTIQLWQQYLRAKNGGYTMAAELALRHIIEQHVAYPILPAPEVQKAIVALKQAHAGPIAEAKKILQAIRTPADISEGLNKISQIPYASSESDSMLSQLKTRLKVFAEAQAALAYGFYDRVGNFNQSSGGDREWEPDLLRIENLLQLELLRKRFADLKVDPPKENESHRDYTERLIKTAAGQKDWTKLLQILSATHPGAQPQSSRIPIYTTGREAEDAISSFVAAQHLEEAGEYGAAIVAYRKVVASTAELVPRQEASERLKKLTQEHPDAEAKAAGDEELREMIRSMPRRQPGRPPGP